MLIYMAVVSPSRLELVAIIDAKEHVRYCKCCYTLTDDELCPICKDAARDHKTIMVVENTRDLVAYEKTGKYEGVYSNICSI